MNSDNFEHFVSDDQVLLVCPIYFRIMNLLVVFTMQNKYGQEKFKLYSLETVNEVSPKSRVLSATC